jgi:hypothetical protein
VTNGEELIADGNVALRIERKRRKKVEEIGYPNLAEQATEKTKVEALGLASKVRQKGAKMTTEHQSTQLEEAYGQLLDQIWEVLSEPARTVLSEAQSAAYAENMVHNYCYHPEEYDEAMEKMRLAAAELPDSEHGLLAKVWRAALAAAASIDPDDYETIAGYKVCSGDPHWFYRMQSGMVEETLSEKTRVKMEAERQKALAEREPEDLSDIPF